MTRAINTSIIYYCTKNTLIPSNLSQKMVCSAKALKVAQSTALIRTIMSLLRSSSTRRRFYPLRPSRQAVVTGGVPSPPVRAFICTCKIATCYWAALVPGTRIILYTFYILQAVHTSTYRCWNMKSLVHLVYRLYTVLGCTNNFDFKIVWLIFAMRTAERFKMILSVVLFAMRTAERLRPQNTCTTCTIYCSSAYSYNSRVYVHSQECPQCQVRIYTVYMYIRGM